MAKKKSKAKKVVKKSASKTKSTVKKTAKKTTKKAAKKVTKRVTKKVATKKKSAAKKVTKKVMKKVGKKSSPKKIAHKAASAHTVESTVKSAPTNSAPAQAKPVSQKSLNSGLKIGQVVPEFHAKSTSGDFKLSNFKGKNVVLYFYPKDNTPGCTLEGHDFSEALPKFNSKNTVVFGISKDSVKTHEGFIAKQSYKHHLISDENESVCQLFGVIQEKSMYGRTYLGIDRSTFLIDANGVLTAQWRNVKVNGHVAEVLAKI